MPYKRRYRKRKRTPAYRSRRRKIYRRKYRPTKVMVRQPTGIPDRMQVKLKYTRFFQATGGSVSGYLFRGNGPFDPEVIMGGGQPLGYDTWTRFYKRYKVYASSCFAQVLNNITTSAAGNVLITLIPSSTIQTVGGYGYEELNDMPYVRTKLLAPVSAGTNGVIIKNYMSTLKMFGDTNISDDVYESDVTSLPARRWDWLLRFDTFDTTSTLNVHFKVTITYYMEFFDREQLSSV